VDASSHFIESRAKRAAKSCATRCCRIDEPSRMRVTTERTWQRLQHLEPTLARHLLVEQDQVVGAAPQERHRVVAVRDGVHRVAALLQEEHVRPEQLDLVVDPEDALGRLGREHGRNVGRTTGVGQRKAAAGRGTVMAPPDYPALSPPGRSDVT
jgi:hypothetical protein